MTNRRFCTRFKLGLPVLLFTGDAGMPIVAETRDIACDGFFCFLPHAFPIGKSIRCLILLNNMETAGDACGICIEAEAHVVRLALHATTDAPIGVGCRMTSFHMVPVTTWSQNYPCALGNRDAATSMQAY